MPNDEVKLNRAIERRLNAMLRYTGLAEEALRDVVHDPNNACFGVSEAIESASWEGGRAESYIVVKEIRGAARSDLGWYQKKLKEGKVLLESASRKFHLRCLRRR
jgi:hypothetical protein